jgi:hypothetical protein
MKLLGGAWSKGDAFAAIGVVATILAVPGMPKLFHWDEKPTLAVAKSTPQSSVPITFTGQVSAAGGKPIGGATVIAFQNQEVGQTIRTDANGQFQIQLPANTQSLRLVVTAEGFANSTIQANVRRTVPEEIVLQPTMTSARRQKGSVVTPAPPQPPVQVSPTPASGPPNQGIINNAPNQGIQNNCAPGVVNCDQSIHVENGPPLPTANHIEHTLSQEVLENDYGYHFSAARPFNPAITLVIGVDKVFELPAFSFDCAEPCRLGASRISEVRGQTIASRSVALANAWVSSDSRHYTVLLSSPLSPREGLVLLVTSFDSELPKITGVVSVHPPSQ